LLEQQAELEDARRRTVPAKLEAEDTFHGPSKVSGEKRVAALLLECGGNLF